MKVLRRILGILVMLAGILGLVISLAGLAGVWMIKPALTGFANSTILTLSSTVSTSQKAMEVTGEALGATVDSVDALSEMLGATADTVKDTQPVVDQLNTFLGVNLPATMENATDSLKTAQQAATVLDSSIRSLETFRAVMVGVPIVGSFIEVPKEAYNPEKPLADSLGEVAANLDSLPEMFTDMSANLGKATENLDTIQADLNTMSDSVALISQSLGEYQAMIAQSQSSMDNLKTMLTNIQNNLATILNWVAIGFSVFFGWLLVAQVVILTQGWELFQGTAGRMESGTTTPPAVEPVSVPGD
jgi:hypothetical protein